MPPEETRYQRGLETMQTIFGSGIESALEGLAATSPDLKRCLVEFPFGAIYTRPGFGSQDERDVDGGGFDRAWHDPGEIARTSSATLLVVEVAVPGAGLP